MLDGNTVSNTSEDVQALLDEAMSDKKKIKPIAEMLSCSKRVERQHAAAALHALAQADPKPVAPYLDDLVDALSRPEAQTRWEALETITLMVDVDSKGAAKALDEAESALFDEESGPVRLAAMRYLCKLGSTTPARCDKVWPLIDEGIQCYHGDLEFSDMLVALYDFAGGKLSPEVKQALRDRLEFDATNGKGSMQRRAQQIIDNIK